MSKFRVGDEVICINSDEYDGVKGHTYKVAEATDQCFRSGLWWHSYDDFCLVDNVSSIDHPSHYNQGNFEAIDVIEDWKLGFNLGNTIKYISRAGKKDPKKELEDLKKAAWYLNREIANKEKV